MERTLYRYAIGDEVGKLLAVFYDAAPKEAGANMGRDVGLAWLKLPLTAPKR